MANARQGRVAESLNGWWHTWLDDAADWESEPLVYPGVAPDALPVRAPSTGWQGMEWGMESTRVPGTWEQAREGYHGVGWQWRPIVIPEEWAGRTIRLALGGARQLVEVYLDERPIAYDLDGLTPFSVDLTPRVRPGRQYELGLRVTNPGGWAPGHAGGAVSWGEARLPGGPDVGGLWGGLELQALPRLRVEDAFAAWDVAASSVVVRVTVRNDGSAARARFRLTVVDPAGRVVAGPVEEGIDVTSGGEVRLRRTLTPDEELVPWAAGPGGAHLYRVWADVESPEGVDRLDVPLGLRAAEEGAWANLPDGIARASLRYAHDLLPDPYAAPTIAVARRAVDRALAEGARVVRADVWVAPPAFLDAADVAGLPVVQTLVGVEDPAEAARGVAPAAVALYRRLAEERLRRIIRAGRAHPAILAWRLALPPGAAFDAYAGLACAEDPTRLVAGIAG